MTEEPWVPEHVPTLRQKEVDALRLTPGEGRAKYFRSTVIGQGWLCTEGDDEGVSTWEDEEGVETIALWSNPAYIQGRYGPLFYKIEYFLYTICPTLHADGTRLGIFPVDNMFADVLSSNDFVSWMEAGY